MFSSLPYFPFTSWFPCCYCLLNPLHFLALFFFCLGWAMAHGISVSLLWEQSLPELFYALPLPSSLKRCPFSYFTKEIEVIRSQQSHSLTCLWAPPFCLFSCHLDGPCASLLMAPSPCALRPTSPPAPASLASVFPSLLDSSLQCTHMPVSGVPAWLS